MNKRGIFSALILLLLLGGVVLSTGCMETQSKTIKIKDHGILYNDGGYATYVVSDENDNLYIVYNQEGQNFMLWYSLMEGATYRIDLHPGDTYWDFTLIDDTGGRHITLEEATSQSTIIENNINY